MNRVTNAQTASLNKHGRDGTALFIQKRLDDCTLSFSIRMRHKFSDVGGERNGFKKIVDSFTSLCADGKEWNITAPLFTNQTDA